MRIATIFQPRSASRSVSYNGQVSQCDYVQTVSNCHKRLMTWTERKLRGVATKYLLSYLAWIRIREWFRESIKP